MNAPRAQFRYYEFVMVAFVVIRFWRKRIEASA